MEASRAYDLLRRARLPVVFLITWGRAGSNLLQSFLDGHPQILQMPTLFYLHADWERLLGRHSRSPSDLVRAFVRESSFARDWYVSGLGPDHRGSIDLDRPFLEDRMLRLLGGAESVSPSDLVLALHAAWCERAAIDPTPARALLVHHHIVPSAYALRTARDPIDFAFDENGEGFRWLRDHFPGARILCAVRHPFETFASIWKTMEREHRPVDLSRFFLQFWSLLAHPPLLAAQALDMGDEFRFVHFEDIHQRTSELLARTVAWMGCDAHPCLESSTFLGQLWWGNNPERPINGANPEMARPALSSLPDFVGGWVRALMGQACVMLGYPDPGPPDPPDVPLEHESWLHAHLQDPEDPTRLYALPRGEREAFLERFWKLRRELLLSAMPQASFADLAPDDLTPPTDVSRRVIPEGEAMIPSIEPLPDHGTETLVWLRRAPEAAELPKLRELPGARVWMAEGVDQGGELTEWFHEALPGVSSEPRLNPYHWWDDLGIALRPFRAVYLLDDADRRSREILLGLDAMEIEAHALRRTSPIWRAHPGTRCVPAENRAWPSLLARLLSREDPR